MRMIFQNTPNTEAPREMNTYILDMKALWMAENVIASLHNIYTLRGAPVRDPLNWSKYIGEALYRFGLEADVMFASHHWPRWGNERISGGAARSAPLYVDMMGGSEKILARGRELRTNTGEYMLASEIVNKLVQAEPDNTQAKDLLADIFEQIGYQQENPGLRNSFLAAAYELRSGIPQGETANSSSPDVIRAMSTELFLNFLAIRMDSSKAEGMRFTINLVTPDNGGKFIVELENATLTNIAGFQADKPDLTLTINRSDLEQTMMGAKNSRSPDRKRNRESGRERRDPYTVRLNHGRLRPALRDYARNEGEDRRGRAR